MIFKIESDRKHFLTNFYVFGKKIFSKKHTSEMYDELLKYKEATINGYKFLSFSDPFCCKKTSGELKKTKDVAMTILKSMVKISKENNVPMWLDFGTLIGAYRHKGYIPWDYDFDVCMLREDYKKYKSLFEDYAKSNDFDFVCFSRKFKISAKKVHIGVDCFLLDSFSSSLTVEDLDKIYKKYSKNAAEKKAKKILVSEDDSKKPLIDINNAEKFIKDNKKSVDYVAFDIGMQPRGQSHYFIEKSLLLPLKEIVFEGELMPCPNKYLEWLHNEYENFDNYPPLLNEYEHVVGLDYNSVALPKGVYHVYQTDLEKSGFDYWSKEKKSSEGINIKKFFSYDNDEDCLCTNYYIFGKKFYSKYNYEKIYSLYRKYFDCARQAYELLCFSDVTKCKKATGKLRASQENSIKLLNKIIDKIESNNLIYWIDYSSLLGAVRHKGFIPWERNTNISMPFSDYKQFKNEVKNLFINESSIETEENYSSHKFNFVITDKINNVSCNISPVAIIDSNQKRSDLEKITKRFASSFKKNITHSLDDIDSYFCDFIKKYNFHNTTHLESNYEKYVIYFSDSSQLRNSRTFIAKDFCKLITIEFENRKYKCPSDFMSVLKSEFDNYMDYEPLLDSLEKNSGELSYPFGVGKKYTQDKNVSYWTPEIIDLWDLKETFDNAVHV